MKNTVLLLFVLFFLANSCVTKGENHTEEFDISTNEFDSLNPKIEAKNTEETTVPRSESDLLEIKSLIRKVNSWHDSGNPYGPELILDSAENIYTGLNLFVLDIAAEDLSSTDYFTSNFIKNYSDIYLTIDQKLRSGEYIYEVGTYPPYGSGADPWCNCQDVPYDDPNPWKEIEIETVELTSTSGEFYWNWTNVDSDWGEHRYYFEVKKVDGKWKISHLEGFTQKAFFAKN